MVVIYAAIPTLVWSVFPAYINVCYCHNSSLKLLPTIPLTPICYPDSNVTKSPSLIFLPQPPCTNGHTSLIFWPDLGARVSEETFWLPKCLLIFTTSAAVGTAKSKFTLMLSSLILDSGRNVAMLCFFLKRTADFLWELLFSSENIHLFCRIRPSLCSLWWTAIWNTLTK